MLRGADGTLLAQKGYVIRTRAELDSLLALADQGIRLGPEVFQPEQFAKRAAGAW